MNEGRFVCFIVLYISLAINACCIVLSIICSLLLYMYIKTANVTANLNHYCPFEFASNIHTGRDLEK